MLAGIAADDSCATVQPPPLMLVSRPRSRSCQREACLTRCFAEPCRLGFAGGCAISTPSQTLAECDT